MDRLNLVVTGTINKSFELTNPLLRKQYTEDLKASIKVAKMLNCNMLFTQGGSIVSDLPAIEIHESIVEGSKECAPILEAANITLVVEPVNTLINHPNAYLNNIKEAFEIIDIVGSLNIKVLYDIYHM